MPTLKNRENQEKDAHALTGRHIEGHEPQALVS